MKRLVLLGGGHAHVQVAKVFSGSAPAECAVMLISDKRLTPYSGMLPGLIAGHYSHRQSHIDLAALCAGARIRFVEQAATAIDPERRCVITDHGDEHPYDVLSIDTGSTPPLASVAGAREHALPIKPIGPFIAAIDRIIAALPQPEQSNIAIVGAGAAGFEVSLALDYRIRRRLGNDANVRLHLVGESPQILPDLTPRVRTVGERILRAQGVVLHLGVRVMRVDSGALSLSDGRHIEASHVIFVTGAAPDALFARSGLRTDERGFIVVNAGLQSLSHPTVFACGDVATVSDHPRPKAGVFAVRQGPPLIRNLRRALADESPLPFVPQRRYLVLLSTGRKHAIAARNGVSVHGDWVWRWKDWIDRRFVEQFRWRPAQELPPDA